MTWALHTRSPGGRGLCPRQTLAGGLAVCNLHSLSAGVEDPAPPELHSMGFIIFSMNAISSADRPYFL